MYCTILQFLKWIYFYSITDINECSTNHGGCHENASCTNTIGSHICKCYQGYDGNGTNCIGKQLGCLVINFIYYCHA